MKFKHKPIMVEEVIEGLNIKKNGVYIDGTLGGAGHSIQIVSRLGEEGRLIGIDQDIDALKAAKKNLYEYEDRVIFVHDNYININEILTKLSINKVDGVLLDIGVSSYQLDNKDRGFSYNKDSKLDMRMNQYQKLTAWDVVNTYKLEELTKIIWEYGEETWAERIANFIVKYREDKPINTTLELVDIIKKALPKKVREKGGHPAKQTFQAIRIEVNQEIEVLKKSIDKIIKILNPGGRLAIITFHSLEDKIVKDKFRYLNQECICPSELPICVCDKEREVRIITRKPLISSSEELKNNPRARSAKLRIVEKL